MRKCIILLVLMHITTACNSMLQNKGQVIYINKQWRNAYERTIKQLQNREEEVQGNDSSGTNSSERIVYEDDFNYRLLYQAKGEITMENLNELLTVIGSAIAGVYCAVKAIVSFIKKLTKKE